MTPISSLILQEYDNGDEDFEDDVELPSGPPLAPGSIVKALYDYEPAEMSPNDEDGLVTPFPPVCMLKLAAQRRAAIS